MRWRLAWWRRWWTGPRVAYAALALAVAGAVAWSAGESAERRAADSEQREAQRAVEAEFVVDRGVAQCERGNELRSVIDRTFREVIEAAASTARPPSARIELEARLGAPLEALRESRRDCSKIEDRLRQEAREAELEARERERE